MIAFILFGAAISLWAFWPMLREWREVRRERLWWRLWTTTCEPNVIVGGSNWCRVVSYSCGDKICRCGGTKIPGYLLSFRP